MKVKRFLKLPVVLTLIIVMVGSVTALIYWTGVQTVSQTIKMVATGEVVTEPIILDDLDEMSTENYSFDKALTVTTAKDNENLKVTLENSSENLDNYTSYKFELIVDTVPSGSTLTGTVVTITEADSLPAIKMVTLDVAGTYKFDYKFTVTAGDLDVDVGVRFDFKFEVEMV